LVQLKGFKRLESLYLVGTSVTDAGAKALQEALPGLQVLRQADLSAFSLPAFAAVRPDLDQFPGRKPGEPVHRDNAWWGLLLTIGVGIFVVAIAAGVYKARRPE
jgi:hypothetical protein